MGVSANYSLIFVIASEIFPTEVRTKAISFGMAISTFGGSISPLINDTLQYGSHVPFIIYGIVSLTALISSLFIPESKNVPILDTMEDGRNFHHSVLEKVCSKFAKK